MRSRGTEIHGSKSIAMFNKKGVVASRSNRTVFIGALNLQLDKGLWLMLVRDKNGSVSAEA